MRRRFGLLLLSAATVGLGCSSEESSAPGAPPRADLATRLAQDTGVEWAVAQNPEYGTASYLEPVDDASPVLAPGEDPVQAALGFIDRYKDAFGLVDTADELTLEETGVDALDLTYVAFLQHAHELPVFGNRLTVTFDASGAVSFVSGRVAPNANSVDPSPSLSEKSALDIARGELSSLHPSVDPASVTADTAELVIYAADAANATLTWQIEVSSSSSSVAYRMLVDADDGAVLEIENLVQGADAAGSGNGERFYVAGDLHDATDLKSFTVTKLAAFDTTLGYTLARSGTKTRTALEGREWESDGSPRLYLSFTPTEWEVDGLGMGQAVDAYFHLGLIDHYFRVVHGRKSYDGKKSKLKFLAHAPDAMNDAYWGWRDKLIHFGNRSDGTLTSFASDLDMCAHELQHGVTQSTVDLVYARESGAINESLSDIFGACVEHYFLPGPQNATLADNWWGAGKPLRNMADPAALGFPTHVRDYKKTTLADDDGGVHTNSSIQNHAFYLMTVGGTHGISLVNIDAPLGWGRSEKLWYAILKGKSFAKIASFKDVARATVGKAKSLKGGTKKERQKTVACAWLAVGVLDAAEVEKSWKVECGGIDVSTDAPGGSATGGDPGGSSGGSGTQPPNGTGSCFDGTITCGAGQICSWNGPATGYCCKQPWVGQEICFADQECAPGVCGLAGDKKFYCTMPDAVACEAQ